MLNKKINELPTSVKNDIVDFVNQQLEKYEEVEKIFIGQKSDDAFEIMVITNTINPDFEKKLIELEYEVEEKYKVPSRFSTFSNASYAAVAG